MTKRMLIDALHADETRVVIADNAQLLDFDFVTAAKKQIKGNVYLAKITRVEPSLQAAFVEYGGGKQGFLPFAEIHPDYYQIPVSDRQRLMEEAMAEAAADDDNDRPLREDDEDSHDEPDAHINEDSAFHAAPENTAQAEDYLPEAEQQIPTFLEQALSSAPEEESIHGDVTQSPANESQPVTQAGAQPDASLALAETTQTETAPEDVDFISYMEPVKAKPLAAPTPTQTTPTSETEAQPGSANGSHEEPGNTPAEDETETVSGEESERRPRRPNFMRRYKIQEVIKRGQVVLVQVIKEERGNKGVSLSTYISLAGRYCVLMPNSPKDGGGISRKIQSSEDRKRLRQISAELRVSAGMSAIFRTAGMDRSQAKSNAISIIS